jgi:hypothetical protein
MMLFVFLLRDSLLDYADIESIKSVVYLGVVATAMAIMI